MTTHHPNGSNQRLFEIIIAILVAGFFMMLASILSCMVRDDMECVPCPPCSIATFRFGGSR